MNNLFRVVCAGLLVTGLGACANTHSSSVARASAPPAPAPLTEGQPRADALYVATIEHVARRRGVEVHWVNPPKKKASPNQ